MLCVIRIHGQTQRSNGWLGRVFEGKGRGVKLRRNTHISSSKEIKWEKNKGQPGKIEDNNRTTTPCVGVYTNIRSGCTAREMVRDK